jgi:hypothetical protein
VKLQANVFVRPATHSAPLIFILVISLWSLTAPCQDTTTGLIPLPTSKLLGNAASGHIGFVNCFPAAIALSPDGHYAAVLNDGYGTAESRTRQSISVLNLSTSQMKDFSRPDAVNAAVLNKILWRDRKGNLPMPTSKHPVLQQSRKQDSDRVITRASTHSS